MSKRTFGYQIPIAIDQLFNTLLAGHADETLSARAWRMQHLKKRWALMRRMIDLLFFWQEDHCYQSYLSEKERKHYPEYYKKYNSTD
ncbi:Uncharacterised protein [Oligella urethralis]|uniref:DNA helicase UvrD n=1 Tax=Oligella urethralis TaxID=90245 RepID=UPI000DFDF09B|nr:DNA helicase UvrD [Oligella urethralis]SUA63205.1 Uncharacterised protein [Oligella urethralis]